jgi:hypothetical protein
MNGVEPSFFPEPAAARGLRTRGSGGGSGGKGERAGSRGGDGKGCVRCYLCCRTVDIERGRWSGCASVRWGEKQCEKAKQLSHVDNHDETVRTA